MEDLLKKIEERIDNKQFLINKNKWTYKLKYKFYDLLIDYAGIIIFFIICLFTSLMISIACYFRFIDMVILVPITCMIGIPFGCVLLCSLCSKLVDLARQLQDEIS